MEQSCNSIQPKHQKNNGLHCKDPARKASGFVHGLGCSLASANLSSFYGQVKTGNRQHPVLFRKAPRPGAGTTAGDAGKASQGLTVYCAGKYFFLSVLFHWQIFMDVPSLGLCVRENLPPSTVSIPCRILYVPFHLWCIMPCSGVGLDFTASHRGVLAAGAFLGAGHIRPCLGASPCSSVPLSWR